MLKLSPKTKRNISRIIPHVLIWVLVSWVFIFTELGLARNQNLNPDTDIAFTIPVLIFAQIANVIMGVIIGLLEVVYLEKRFASRTLLVKVASKFLIYLCLFLLVIVVFYPIAFSFETGKGVFHLDAWTKLGRFLGSVSFATTLFQLSVTLFVSLMYSAISENLGHRVLLNFFTGKYHMPVVEKRIFMFLDMKSSTTIAEELGNLKYFELLKAYYNLMSDPIVNTYGEVYQYIGDEIVISWKLDQGVQNSNCLRCFFEIQDSLKAMQQKLLDQYGFEIGFKAGIHVGEATVGEIGALKREVVFTGDVLNTTARIQALCKEFESDLLISGELKEILPKNEFEYKHMGSISLRGKNRSGDLYRVTQ